MEKQKIDMFLMTKGNFFSGEALGKVKQKLEELPEEASDLLIATDFKNPTTALIISLLGGSLGLDRFYLGEVGMGIAKLLTCGGCGIWAIIDLFLVMGKTKKVNLMKFIELTSKIAK